MWVWEDIWPKGTEGVCFEISPNAKQTWQAQKNNIFDFEIEYVLLKGYPRPHLISYYWHGKCLNEESFDFCRYGFCNVDKLVEIGHSVNKTKGRSVVGERVSGVCK